MKHTTRTTRRSAGLISVAAAAALVLTACGGEDEAPADETSAEETVEETTEETEETADDAVETEAPAEDDPATETEAPAEDDAATETQAPADDAAEETAGDEAGATEAPAAGGAAGDFETTAPGTEFAFGEPAVLHAQEREEGEEYYAFGYIESSVTEIVAGDASFFEQFDDVEEYEGMTPYFIMSEHEVLSAEGDEGATNIEPGFEGVLDDGSPAQGLIVISTGIAECPNEYFEDFVAGATATTCNVALAPEGQEVTGAAWTGVREIDGGYDENAYLEAPVMWQ
ncbi:hypothetical protein [Ornithinimicrobium faecis]|uniref:Uncharacterized protein n=1 Tax=Ornithinimicrobium faecis TaxID=2934158 RepID=A0ABY4YWR5_9MICO|nr:MULTISPECIES: hypothetical protein [unclassified Ornithinimicrobium]USQ80974.1 hypothetical protein NF556_04815 [Ornithinimicrobium sp. HY1793]